MTKRSAAKQPKPPTFFIDRSLGRHIVPAALQAAGYVCEIADKNFAPDAEDEYWLRQLGRKKWIVLTKDERIRYRPLELQALRSAGLAVFIVICGNVTGEQTARIILKAMPKIMEAIKTLRPPYICFVYKNGSIKLKA